MADGDTVAEGGTERRIAPRVDVTFSTLVDPGEGMFTGNVIDLSVTGAFVHTDRTRPVGTLLTLFPLGDADVDLFEIRAQVMRVVDGRDGRPPGLGVRFASMSKRDRLAIAKLMRLLPRTSGESLTHMRQEAVADEAPANNRPWMRIGLRMMRARSTR